MPGMLQQQKKSNPAAKPTGLPGKSSAIHLRYLRQMHLHQQSGKKTACKDGISPFNQRKQQSSTCGQQMPPKKTNCGIYEITASNGRKSFKIFRDEFTLKEYLEKNRGKSCTAMRPVYRRPEYREFPHAEIRRLTAAEAEAYIKEQSAGV